MSWAAEVEQAEEEQSPGLVEVVVALVGSVVAEEAAHILPHAEVDVSPVVACRDLPGDAGAECEVAAGRAAAAADYPARQGQGYPASGQGVEYRPAA